jgi:hypothetical protein
MRMLSNGLCLRDDKHCGRKMGRRLLQAQTGGDARPMESRPGYVTHVGGIRPQVERNSAKVSSIQQYIKIPLIRCAEWLSNAHCSLITGHIIGDVSSTYGKQVPIPRG